MTKRKSSRAVIPRSKSKKRVPFTVPKNAATKALIVQNASTSPLLRLPPEIRNKIWTEVLGCRLIHLEYQCGPDDAVLTWQHQVCEDDGPEDQPGEKITFTRNGMHVVYWCRPHYRCNRNYPRLVLALPVESQDYETMHLTVLRSCRQIYVEANLVLWSTNTFSFTAPIPFRQFIMTRTGHQKRLIRTLRLEMEWSPNHCVVGAWVRALNMTVVRSLTGLRAMRLQIIHDMEVVNYRRLVKEDPEFPQGTFWCDTLQKFSVLSLARIEVAVRGTELAMYQFGPGQWTERDRKELAGRLQAILLNPKGAEVYAAYREKEKELSRILNRRSA